MLGFSPQSPRLEKSYLLLAFSRGLILKNRPSDITHYYRSHADDTFTSFIYITRTLETF